MAKKAEKVYLDEAGNESRHANPDARVLLFKFSNGHEIQVQPSALPKEILQCAALHGLGQKIGDAYASSKDVDEAIERAETVVENLSEGTWIDRAEGAVRTSLLAEALQRVKPDKYADVESAAKEIKENWSADKRKQVLDSESGVPALIAAYATLQAERAADRARKAAEAAKGSNEGLDTL